MKECPWVREKGLGQSGEEGGEGREIGLKKGVDKVGGKATTGRPRYS